MMISSTWRFGGAILVACAFLLVPLAANAQEKTPFPALSDKRVYVAGVPDRYSSLESQINQLERSSPQTYYVVVVKGTGPGENATKNYATELFELWRSQAAKTGRAFDSDRSVLIVLAIDKDQIAVRPGTVLQSRRLGLNEAKVERDLIRKVFIDQYAIHRQYPEGLAALLNATNDAIAERDPETARAPVRFTSSGSPKVQTKSTAATPSTGIEPSKGAETLRQPQVGRQSQAQNPPAAVAAKPSADWKTALGVVIPIVAAAIALILIGLWLGYRRTRSRLGARIKEVKSKAVEVMDRLDALKERLKLLPSSPEFKEPMAGETEAFYRSVKEKNDKLWDGWLQVMEVLDKAEKMADRSGSLFSKAALNDAEKLIEQKGSFQELERQSKETDSAIDRLDAAHKTARAVLEAIKSAHPKMTAAIAAVTKDGLPTKPYEGELDSLSDGTNQAGARMLSDPMGTQKVLEWLRSKSDVLLERIERVDAIFTDARQVKNTIETIRRQVAVHRAQGLKLAEDGGDPDRALLQSERAQAEVITSLREGDPETGATKLNESKALAQEAQLTIEQVQKARTACERDPAARTRETERLRTAMTQAESYQSELERGFAPLSWTGVARNLEQAQALLATFDRQVQEASAAGSVTRQEYLKGSRLLEELARQQQIVLRLMSGLGEQLNSLFAARSESQSLIDQLASSERQAESLVEQNDLIVGDATRASLAKAQQTRQQILLRSTNPRPDWPALRQSLAEALEDVSIARAQAEEEIQSYEQLQTEFETTRRNASRVYALLSSHQEDRLAANQHYQAAADALDRIATIIQEPRGAAAAWLAQLRDAASDLQRSEELAREDIRLAAQAQSEISDCASAINRTQASGWTGIYPEISNAQSQLIQAEQLLRSQNYEQSIQTAGAATQLARQLHYAAIQQAMLEQMAIAAEQRRRAVRMATPAGDGISFGAAAASAAAATILERNMSESAASEAEAEPEPATAGGSWGGETAQGSW
jgi:uncharacterized membrane protein YgcG